MKRSLHFILAVLALLYFLLMLQIGNAAALKGNKSSVLIENNVPKIVLNGTPVNNMFGINVYCAGVNPDSSQYASEMKKIIDRTSRLKIPILSFQVLWEDYDPSESVPSDAEEAARRFKTLSLDEIMEYAAKRNVYVVLQLTTHNHWALPKWWKSFGQNASGRRLIVPSSTANETFNRKASPVASYQNPDYRALITALFTRIVNRYKEHPALLGWATHIGATGENGYAPNYLDMTLNPSLPRIDFLTAMADYSSLAQRRFAEWLEVKYSIIENLNSAWGSGYRDFREVRPPIPKVNTLDETFRNNGDNRPSMIDWQWFRHDALMDEWRFFSNLFRRLDPDKILMGNTLWTPMGPETGSEFMNLTAIQINSERLIDADIVYPGLTNKDYQPEFNVTNSYCLLDYTFFSRFSKNYGMVRILGMENWVKRTNPGRIDVARSIALKEILKREGCYLWFNVVLDNDKFPKPDWSWQEVEDVVKRSNADELKNVVVKEPELRFYYDALNPMSHYTDPLPGLKTTGLQFSLAKAIFEADRKVSGFVSDRELASLDPTRTRVVALANQRILSPTVVTQLKKYCNAGGTLLMIGSNGVFDSKGRRDDTALRALVPLISTDQLQTQYEWGLRSKIMVPFVVMKRAEVRFDQFDVSAAPAVNYLVLRKGLSESIPLPDKGNLAFNTTINRIDPGQEERSGTMGITPHPEWQQGPPMPRPPGSVPPPMEAGQEGPMGIPPRLK